MNQKQQSGMGNIWRPLWVTLALLLLIAPARAATHEPATSAEPAASGPVTLTTASSIALFGRPKYKPGFHHFDYVNANAPKGGVVRMTNLGSYDSFNPFALRGTAPLININLLYDTLMVASGDEQTTQYGLLAQSLTYPSNYAWVEYKLRPHAYWHDGRPITADDVVFTYDRLTKYGSPFAQSDLGDVASVKKVGPDRVRFTFKRKGNKLSILNVGLMPVVPKHYWEGKDFTAPVVVPPLTSGPYKISAYQIGRTLTLKRVKDYWGRNLAVNRGRFNYGELRFDYYRDDTVAFEAFKAGHADIRYELSQQRWATGYNFPAVQSGLVRKELIPVGGGFLLRGLFFNLRKPQFQDRRVRDALNYAFDFTWINKNYYYGFYVRTTSYFGPNNRSAARSGLPSKLELKLLAPYKNIVPRRVFTQTVTLPKTDGTQEGLRNNLAKAMALLSQAGYVIKNGKLISSKTGRPFSFKILVSNPEFKLAAQNWSDNLRLLGIDAEIKFVDTTQYAGLMRHFNFQVAAGWIPQVSPPGADQRDRWGSKAADAPGSLNWMGIKNPAVDGLINDIVAAKDKASYLAAIHALDRVLMWNFYCVPLYNGGNRIPVAYWNKFGQPKRKAIYEPAYIMDWWIDPQKDAALNAARARLGAGD